MKRYAVAIAGCLLWLQASARSQTITDVNTHAWFMYFGDHPVSDRWGVHLEAQARRSDVVNRWQQLLLRPGVNWQLRSNIMLTAGYAYVRTHPYGDFPGKATFPEHRIFQQALIKHKAGKLGVQHRLRLEQRYVGKIGAQTVPDGWEYRNRFRYMLRGDIPLQRDALKRKGFYVGLYDEVFLGFGANRGPQAVDQNRAYGALGYNFGKIGKLETGYLHQYVPQRNGRIVEHNHTLQVAFYSSFPFRKKSEARSPIR